MMTENWIFIKDSRFDGRFIMRIVTIKVEFKYKIQVTPCMRCSIKKKSHTPELWNKILQNKVHRINVENR